MKIMTGDLACFIKAVRGNLEEIIGSCVADTIGTGSEKFEKKIKLTERIFHSKSRSYDCFTFAEMKMFEKGHAFLLNQESYANKVQPLKRNCVFELVRASRHKLACLTHTRPDLCATVALLPRLNMEKLTRTHIQQLKNQSTRLSSGRIKISHSTNWIGLLYR